MDDPSLARGEKTLLPPSRSQDEQRLWVEIWARARDEGPLLGPKLRDQLQQANRQELELCLLAALGLSGGPSAQAELMRALGRDKASERILASFAGIQDRVAADPDRFLRGLHKGEKTQASFLAGRLALLASPWKIESMAFLGRTRHPAVQRIRPLLNALLLAWRLQIDAKGLALPALGDQVPDAGSLADHEERALLILACRRPGMLSRKQLLTFLERPQGARHFGLCSLALGRLDKSASTRPALGNLVTPFYLLGLESCSGELRKELIQGPGLAHSLRWQSWHWCAAVRLLPSQQLASLLPALLAAEPEAVGQAIQALCFRVLVRGERLPESESLKSLVENPGAPESSPYRAILATLAAPGRTLGTQRRKILGPVRSYALDAWREGRIQGKPRIGGARLWRILRRSEWTRPQEGPGSFEAALLEQINGLVWNLLIFGSEYVEHTQPNLDRNRFLPEGLRRTDEAFFRVLDAWLGEYPLFRSW